MSKYQIFGIDQLSYFLGKIKSIFADINHTHTKSEITDFPTIPTKTSQLTNDSGYKTTDNNTTYSISKSGNNVTLTGSDGSTSSFIDSNTIYNVATSTEDGLMSISDKTKISDFQIISISELNEYLGITSSGSETGSIAYVGTAIVGESVVS